MYPGLVVPTSHLIMSILKTLSWRHAAAAVAVGLLSGCLEREETITVHAEGAVSVVHRWKGDADDLNQGAARLPDPSMYEIVRETRIDDNDNEEHILTASAEFGSAAEMPNRFGLAGDPLATEALTFQTEVTVRREGNRTFYRFQRRYGARDWAPYRVFRRKTFTADVEEILDRGNLWIQPLEDRRKVITAAIAYERMKLQYWAEQIMAQVAVDHQQLLEAQLDVRRLIQERIAAEFNTERIWPLLLESPERINEQSERISREIDQMIASRAKQLLDLDDRKVGEMMEALTLIRHNFSVSHDLEDEGFTVRIKLPGRVTGHNGDTEEGGFVVWHFDGQSLRDREHVLTALSVYEEQ